MAGGVSLGRGWAYGRQVGYPLEVGGTCPSSGLPAPLAPLAYNGQNKAGLEWTVGRTEQVQNI